MPFTGTPAAERCEKEVLARFSAGIYRVGQYNRRPIAGSTAWSQHSWGNGLDFHVTEVGSANPAQKLAGDNIAAFLRTNAEALGVKAVLWWVADHKDHVHVDFWPTGIGTPPVSTTGIGRFKYSNGVTVSRRLQEVSPQGNGVIAEEDSDMPLTPEDLQKIADAVWFRLITHPVTGQQRGAQALLADAVRYAAESAAGNITVDAVADEIADRLDG